MSQGTILYVGNFELPDRNAAAHRVVNNAKIFRALGFRSALLGTVRDESFSGYRRISSPDGGAFRDIDLWERAYPASTADWIRQLFDVSDAEVVAEAYGDLKLVIAYNLPFAAFKALKKEFAKRGVRVAYDCTEWNDKTQGSLLKRIYKSADANKLVNRLAKVSDSIITVSKTMERRYSGVNVLLLPPLVDTEDNIWLQKRAEHPGCFEFCFAGSIYNKERLDVIAEAFHAIDNPSLRLTIIGPTKEEFAANYPKIGDEVYEDERLVFLGPLSHSESIKHTLSCDCYLIVRNKTRKNTAGFPTKFAEAFTCGVPIITTDVSDVAAYIDSPEKGIILPDASVDMIREAIESAAARSKAHSSKFIEGPVADLAPDVPSRTLRNTFDYRNFIDETREWINRTLN